MSHPIFASLKTMCHNFWVGMVDLLEAVNEVVGNSGGDRLEMMRSVV